MVNQSGIYPVEYKVLVLPEQTDKKTKGGLYIPDSVKEKEDAARVKGHIIALGGNAFEGWKAPGIPKVGDYVVFAKYGGQIHEGLDGKEYRICNDKDIIAILSEVK